MSTLCWCGYMNGCYWPLRDLFLFTCCCSSSPRRRVHGHLIWPFLYINCLGGLWCSRPPRFVFIITIILLSSSSTSIHKYINTFLSSLLFSSATFSSSSHTYFFRCLMQCNLVDDQSTLKFRRPVIISVVNHGSSYARYNMRILNNL